MVIGLTGVSMNPALVTRGARAGQNNMLVNSVHTACITLGVMVGSWIGGLGIDTSLSLRGPLWIGAALGVLGLLTLSHRSGRGLLTRGRTGSHDRHGLACSRVGLAW